MNKVNQALSKAARKEVRLDAKVDAAADRAAALQAKAAATGSIPAMKHAALAGVNVERVIRNVDKDKAQLQFQTDKKIQVRTRCLQ